MDELKMIPNIAAMADAACSAVAPALVEGFINYGSEVHTTRQSVLVR